MNKGANVMELPDLQGRHLALDERGIGLRATWRPAHGFVNVSLWRDDRCVETFHLTPTAAGELVAFLVGSLAGSVPPPSRPPLRLVTADDGDRDRPDRARRLLARLRHGLAADLDALADRLRRRAAASDR